MLEMSPIYWLFMLMYFININNVNMMMFWIDMNLKRN